MKLRWVYDYLSQFYMRTLQIEKAEKILKIWYSEALKQKNETWTHHHVARKMGYFYYQIGEYEKAASFFELAIVENAFSIGEYAIEIQKISNRLIGDGQVELATKIDNNFLEILKKKDEQLFETHLSNCIMNKKVGTNYQVFFLQKFYRYIDTKNIKKPEEGIKLYKKMRYLYPISSLSRDLQREYTQKWLQYIDKNCILIAEKQKEYMELFNEISSSGSPRLVFEFFLDEILPRIEKISQDKIAIKQRLYNRIIMIMQAHLIGEYTLNKAELIMFATKKIEKLQNKPQKDEADKEFLLAVQKELNFARKIKGYRFWGR